LQTIQTRTKQGGEKLNDLDRGDFQIDWREKRKKHFLKKGNELAGSSWRELRSGGREGGGGVAEFMKQGITSASATRAGLKRGQNFKRREEGKENGVKEIS